MAAENSQQGSEQPKKKKEGYMKSPRAVEYELFGPESPLPHRWRVFNFIKYRIQDNKRPTEAESISREFIIRETGICPSHFARIIAELEEDKLILVKRGNYRDSCATYMLHPTRFKTSVIVPDHKKEPQKPVVDNSAENVDNSAPSVDNQALPEDPNTKMVSEKEAKHQNGASQHQSGVETVVTSIESQAEFPSIAPVLKPLNSIPIALECATPKSFTDLKSGDQGDKIQKQCRWLKETNGDIPFGEWERKAYA